MSHASPPSTAFALIPGRHALPPHQGAVFTEVVPADWAQGIIPDPAAEFLQALQHGGHVDVITTGFGPAVVEACRHIARAGRSATFWHYDPGKQAYWPQSF